MPEQVGLPDSVSENVVDVIRGWWNNNPVQNRSQLNDWLAEHNDELTADAFYELAQLAQTGTDRSFAPEVQARWDAFEGKSPYDQADEAVKNAVATPGVPRTVGPIDADKSGTIDKSEEAAYETAKKRSIADLEDKGLSTQEATAGVDAITGIDEMIPDILTSYMGRPIVLGDDPDFEGRIKDLISTWNTYNPDRIVGDRNELYQVLRNANDPDVQDVMDAVFLGTDPVIDYKIPLANGGSVSVTAQQFDAFQKGGFGKYGQLDRVGLTNLVRITDRIGLTKHDGSNAWQMTAALARAKAADTENAVFTQSGYKGPKDPDVQKSVYNANKIASLGLRFKEGRYIYGGNDSLAYIHTLDPTLAAKWANTPDDVSQEEVGRLRQLINNGGFDQQQLSAMGYEALSFEDWANDPARSGNRNGGGGGGRMRPDPVAVRQAARDMWMNLYASEPSEQQLNDLIATVDGSISNAPNSQSVDVEAQIRQGLEANPQYAELYGSRPAGMSEQEWQTQFRAGAASLLGNEAADPNSIRSGMRSGQYQTTLGAVAGSRQAWGNSTFRGRLAQAAQIVAEQT